MEIFRARLKSDIPANQLESLLDAASMAKHVETVLDQIKHLRTAVNHTIERAHNKTSNASESECKFTLFVVFSKVFLL